MTDRIEADIDRSVRRAAQRQRAQASGKPFHTEITFESDRSPPSGLMKVIERGDFVAEIRFLRYPDTNNPMDPPWQVKISGPDPLSGGSFGPVWSGSFDREDEAIDAAERHLKKHVRRHVSRAEPKIEPKIESSFGPGDKVGYAVFDPSVSGFVRGEGMFGGVIFEDLGTAREVAEPGQFILDLEIEDLG